MPKDVSSRAARGANVLHRLQPACIPSSARCDGRHGASAKIATAPRACRRNRWLQCMKPARRIAARSTPSGVPTAEEPVRSSGCRPTGPRRAAKVDTNQHKGRCRPGRRRSKLRPVGTAIKPVEERRQARRAAPSPARQHAHLRGAKDGGVPSGRRNCRELDAWK